PNSSVLVRAIFIWVYGADSYHHFARRAPVRHGRGPGRGEHIRVLDRESELQVLAPVIGVHIPWLGAEILFSVPFQSFFRNFVINQPISLDDVQSFGLRRAVPVDHGKGAYPDPHGVYDQRAAFVMADGIPV